MKFHKDKYRSRRGGTSKWLKVSCRECSNELFVYQKDGVGQLLRLYLDRIVQPPEGGRPYRKLGYEEIGPLACKYCGVTIGLPMIYEKHGESRLAERIIPPGPLTETLSENEVMKLKIDIDSTIKISKSLEE